MNEEQKSGATSASGAADDPVATAIMALLAESDAGKAITPESAARVLGVLEAANVSAAKGSRPVKPVFV